MEAFDSPLPHSLALRWPRIKRQFVVAEDVAGAVVDVHLAHLGAFHHGVQRDEVLFDEADEVDIEADGAIPEKIRARGAGTSKTGLT